MRLPSALRTGTKGRRGQPELSPWRIVQGDGALRPLGCLRVRCAFRQPSALAEARFRRRTPPPPPETLFHLLEERLAAHRAGQRSYTVAAAADQPTSPLCQESPAKTRSAELPPEVQTSRPCRSRFRSGCATSLEHRYRSGCLAATGLRSAWPAPVTGTPARPGSCETVCAAGGRRASGARSAFASCDDGRGAGAWPASLPPPAQRPG